MASKVESEKLQDLVCPMCLDVFKDPTILSCGHTFCKGCLETYDEQRWLKHLVCPVCRKATNLGKDRIAGLTPNFLALGIQDELNVVLPSRSFCPLHSEVHNDIFCEVCKKFICLTCYFDDHEDHKIKKKEELEMDLKRKTEILIRTSNTRKTQIAKTVNNAEQQKIKIDCLFSNVEKEIKDEFAKKFTVLQKNKETLIKKLDDIRKDTENHLEVYTGNYRPAMDHINRSTIIRKSCTGKNLDPDTVKELHLQCIDLEKSLRKTMDEESMIRLMQKVDSARYCPTDEKFLALGNIELGVQETTSKMQHFKTAAGGNKKAEQVERSRQVVQNRSLNIVRKVDAPDNIRGMSVLSQDTVVVGYGCFTSGSDCFSVTGEKTQYFQGEVGKVWDTALLTDGRSAVSHGWDTVGVYRTQDTLSKGTLYKSKEGIFSIRLCSDQYDNIYAVNGNPRIYIFHGRNSYPQREVPTGDIKPRQICVTKTGVLITSTCNTTPSTVTLFDREGCAGSSITTDDDNECLYAAADSQDRMLVASVRRGSDVFRLTRYKLQGTTPIEQLAFKELKLLCAIDMFFSYCYMTSLTPRLIAFANSTGVYFIELPD